MRISAIIFSLFLMGLQQLVLGQAPFQNPIQLHKRDGLPNNNIHDIVQDQQGFIWIATSSGLCRYDGSDLKIYDLIPSDSSQVYTKIVRQILIDKETAKLWLATELGIQVYDPFTDSFEAYLPKEEEGMPISTRIDYCYQDRQGNIWAGNFTNGLMLYQRQTDDFKRFLPSSYFDTQDPDEIALLNQVSGGLIQDIKDDHIFWLVTKKGLVRWDRQLDKMTIVGPGPELGWSTGMINSFKEIYQHSDGSILIGTWSYGFVHWRPGSQQWLSIQHYTDDKGSSRAIGSIMSILAKDEELIYISNGFNTLFEFDVQQQRIINHWQGSRKEKEQYTLHLKDTEGNFWAGLGRGISIYSPLAQHMQLISIPPGDEDDSFRPDGLIWEENIKLAAYSKSKGIYRYVDGELEPALSVSKEDIPSYINDLLLTPEGEVWFIGPSELYRFDAGAGTFSRLTDLDEWKGARFTGLSKDSRGDIWLGSFESGVFRYDFSEKRWHHYQEEIETPTEDRHSIWLWGFTEDREGKIWLRTGTGYSVYYPPRDSFANFPYQSGQQNNYQGINNFCLDKEGTLWALAGQEGVGKIDPRYPNQGVIKKYGPDDGMYLNSPWMATCDDQGDIWMTDQEGLARFDPEQETFEYFDTYYGLPSYDDILDIDPLQGNLLKTTANGQVALQYRRGLALFYPDSLQRNTNRPIPYIADIQVNDQAFPLDSSITLKREIQLKANENKIALGFSAINFTVPHLTKYRFRLLGHEEKWIDAGDRRYTTYTNLDGGDYTFQVIAANSDGLWSDQIAELYIHLATPWYNLWQVRFVFVLLLVGLIYLIYQRRIQRIRSQEQQQREFDKKLANVEMNALRAQMNPHFIFNCLNSIDSFIIRNETHKASEYLNDFARLIRLILQNSRSNLVNLQDELEALKLYLQMEQLRFREKFSYDIHVGPEINQPATVIPPMLVQPYVENAVWHGLLHKRGGNPGEVVVDISQKADQLIINIEDNGIGRKKAAELNARRSTPSRKSMGMQITGDRIAMINQLYDTKASVETIDLYEEDGEASGTRVVIKIPI